MLILIFTLIVWVMFILNLIYLKLILDILIANFKY